MVHRNCSSDIANVDIIRLIKPRFVDYHRSDNQRRPSLPLPLQLQELWELEGEETSVLARPLFR